MDPIKLKPYRIALFLEIFSVALFVAILFGFIGGVSIAEWLSILFGISIDYLVIVMISFGIFVFLCYFIMFAPDKFNRKYIIGDNGIIVHEGFYKKEVREIPFQSITDLELQQIMIPDKIFNTYTMIFHVKDEGTSLGALTKWQKVFNFIYRFIRASSYNRNFFREKRVKPIKARLIKDPRLIYNQLKEFLKGKEQDGFKFETSKPSIIARIVITITILYFLFLVLPLLFVVLPRILSTEFSKALPIIINSFLFLGVPYIFIVLFFVVGFLNREYKILTLYDNQIEIKRIYLNQESHSLAVNDIEKVIKRKSWLIDKIFNTCSIEFVPKRLAIDSEIISSKLKIKGLLDNERTNKLLDFQEKW